MCVLVVLDDVGYAQLGCYGSDIETPVHRRPGRRRVRLANFHTTSLCSPTRACLLTGRNHHRSGMGRVADLAVGFPGYWGKPPRENGYLSEILRAAGYASYAIGKWHLSPEDETNMAASRATWPLASGFDRWYGFHGGETHQFVPALYHDNHVGAPARSMQDGYHLTEDLADRAIEFLADLRAVDPDKPFFLYFATGACHSPHQPPPPLARALPRPVRPGLGRLAGAGLRAAARRRPAARPRPGCRRGRPGCPPGTRSTSGTRRSPPGSWSASPGSCRTPTSRSARVLDFLDELGERDNTIVVVVSDNGASAEGGATGSINDVRMVNLDPASNDEMYDRIDEIGGPLSHNNYPWGWTMAGNTPFRRWKREVHEGGIADPCIISWPRGPVERGAIRLQFTHAIDVLPTLTELIGIDLPADDRRHRADRARWPELRLPARPGHASRRRNGTRPSTRRCSDRGRSTTRAGRR